jgi:hypothetical protein
MEATICGYDAAAGSTYTDVGTDTGARYVVVFEI